MIDLHNIDCMEYMRGLPDKAYDLAIVDPPYGINVLKQKAARDEVGTGAIGAKMKRKRWEHKPWDDSIPMAEYFCELRRVSTDQIVWGGNYMTAHLDPSPCWIFWDKKVSANLPDGELAWTSFDTGIQKFDWLWTGCWQQEMGARKEVRIHPTQKPVALYRWLLQNYAKPGQKILDTHGGSMSIAIACDIEGYDLDLCELDKDYFEAGKKRLEQHQSQPGCSPQSHHRSPNNSQ